MNPFKNIMPPYQPCRAPGRPWKVCRNIPFTSLSKRLARHVTQYTPKDKVVTRVSLAYKSARAMPDYRVEFHLNTGDSVCTMVPVNGYESHHYEEIHKLAQSAEELSAKG